MRTMLPAARLLDRHPLLRRLSGQAIWNLLEEDGLPESAIGEYLDRFEAAKAEGIEVSKGGTYLVMEGPQFSTRAESLLYRSWGCDVIGMTNMPEAKLAREAEICYATVAMVTDFDCWHEDHSDVDIASIIRVMKGNSEKAQRLILNLARNFPKQHPACPLGSDRALDMAIITRRDVRDATLVAKLDAIAGRVLQSRE